MERERYEDWKEDWESFNRILEEECSVDWESVNLLEGED
jgi:hypothetical protein